MDEIEKAAFAGLEQQLEAPHLLKAFAKTCQDERERLAREKRRVIPNLFDETPCKLSLRGASPRSDPAHFECLLDCSHGYVWGNG